MKYLQIIVTFMLIACNGKQKDYPKAENALDAGREFIQSQLLGNFSKADFYLLASPTNKIIMNGIEKKYREKNREDRQQWRAASINIKELKEINDSLTFIYFQNSSDKQADTICVVKQKGNWLIDISKKE